MSELRQTLVIDEWLWHDIRGENGEEKQKEAFDFLQCICKVCDKIACMENSPFVKKFWEISKIAGEKKELRDIVIFFIRKFIYNSLKCEIYPYEVSQPDLNIKPDDAYIYSLYDKIESTQKKIITTDTGLIEEFKKNNIKVYHRDEFIRKYLQKCENIP